MTDQAPNTNNSEQGQVPDERAQRAFDWRRLIALVRKESLQAFRDPSTILIAIVLPVILLFLFAYAVSLDVRVVAAISPSLSSSLSSFLFLSSLFFPLLLFPLFFPPLRQRRDDVPALVEQFAGYFAERDGLQPRTFATTAMQRLQRHGWPGNLRELRNLLQRLTLLGSGEVSVSELDAMLDGRAAPAMTGSDAGYSIDFSLPLREAREQFERSYLSTRLEQAGGSVGKLARMTGMERTHLYRKLRDLGIDIRSGDGDG